ncbi:hypothetical protein CLV46_0893 [Diaminobutyricimonas aerilata]|uniref:Uncharacterized protein n=1 Tax=Diaminobutyricimonas aerilata TaxID=1162967 RepID=A0A2M9CHI5_9MICO|nr:hypothetical protein [Diaminobutyricimonas aerilata]PJJ71348.1 hypothetical protein CLV46_0893 [Diaminobutyricimonas aerilata]
MPQRIESVPPAALATLPGASALAAVRRLLVWALGAAWAYGLLAAGTRTVCWQGVSPDQSIVFSGPVPAEPGCHTLTLSPTGFVYAGIAVAALIAITNTLRWAATEAEAARRLQRARVAVLLIPAIALAAAHLWLWSVPLDAQGTGAAVYPFLFGTITLTGAPPEMVPF